MNALNPRTIHTMPETEHTTGDGTRTLGISAPKDSSAQLTPNDFEALFQSHFRGLCVVAGAFVGPTDAEDVVQEAGIIALDKLARFDPTSDYRAWMATIVRNVARNTQRRRTRRTHHERAAQAAAPPPSRHTGEGERADERRHIRNALQTLGHLEATCILLKIGFGYTYQEISNALDIPESTARSHVYRARRRLAEHLEPKQDPDS